MQPFIKYLMPRNSIYKFHFLLLVIYLSFVFMSCSTHLKSDMGKKKVKDSQTNQGTSIIKAPVVFKNFVKKNGQVTDKKEAYIRRSIQDYFIKFCESKIELEALERSLAGIEGVIKAVTLEVEFRDGYWDICDENFNQQSRRGEYIIIHRIIANEKK